MATVEDMQQLLQLEEQEQRTSAETSRAFESDSFKFSELVLKDDMTKIPEHLQKGFWVFLDKELSLTNLKEEDIGRILFGFDLVKLDLMMSKPDYKLNFNDMADFDAMRLKALIKAKRSTGDMMRERAMFMQQIKQLLTNEQQQVKGGWLSKLGSAFGGKK